jgi:hypothetical protein
MAPEAGAVMGARGASAPAWRRWWWASALLLAAGLGVSIWWFDARSPSSPAPPSSAEPPEAPPVAPRARAAGEIYREDTAKVRHFGPEWRAEGEAPLPPVPEGAFKDQDFIQGAALGLYFALPGLDYPQLFKEIKGLGCTHVSLVVAWSMRDIRGVTVRPHPVETVPDEAVRRAIAQARAEGLEVMLFPILHVDRRRSGEWRGKLAPRDMERWWEEYRAFVLHYAGIAQEGGVDIYSVGSELLSLEHEEARWRGLIKEVRGVYQGRLTYSANWDHFDHVSFWSALDIAGMTGYFELSNEEEPTLSGLRQTWDGAVDVIATYPARAAGRPLILTEVGYPSQQGGVRQPWNYTTRNSPDARSQYRAFRAMYESWRERALEVERGEEEALGLSGFFVWNWYGYGGEEDIHYTLRGKPAESVIRRWFRGEAPKEGP